ncbi:MAG: serine hydrolase domain-containing protein, partial [Sphingomicrobium sp.]
MRIAALMAAMMMAGASAAAEVPGKAEVARLAGEAMASSGAKGLAIAIVDRGKVVSVQAFGARNAKGDPLNPDTIMYGASLTKAVFGYYAMMLVDDGKLKLDRPIAAILPKPLPDYGNLDHSGNWGDLAGDKRWKQITPRQLLTHSSGFANFSFIEPDGKLKFHFDPGARYAYSGEGIILLQFAIEQGLGIDVGAEMTKRMFAPLGMKRTSLQWRPD